MSEQCAPTEAAWAVEPLDVRYVRSDGILHVDVAVQHTPATIGGEAVPYEDELFLGVTVLDTQGHDIDLAVQTVFPAQIGEPFTFTAEVGGEVRDIIFGLWGKKIAPCQVDRSGCRNFGFVLDESLAAWPPGTYTEQPPRRQRILESAPTLAIQGAGAPWETLEAAGPRAQAALGEAVKRFGLQAPAPVYGLAPQALPLGLAVLHRDPHDGPLASAIADRLGSTAVAPDPSLPADFVIRIGGSDETLACQRDACTGREGDALQECLAGCP